MGNAKKDRSELRAVWDRRPRSKAPVRDWVKWFERQAELWDEIAATDDFMPDDARWMADRMRRRTNELQEDFQTCGAVAGSSDI